MIDNKMIEIELIGDNTDRINKTSNFISQGYDPEKILKDIRMKISDSDEQTKCLLSATNFSDKEFLDEMSLEHNFVGIDKNNKFAKYLISNNLGISHPTMDNILIIRYQDVYDQTANIKYKQNVGSCILTALSKYGIEVFIFRECERYA